MLSDTINNENFRNSIATEYCKRENKDIKNISTCTGKISDRLKKFDGKFLWFIAEGEEIPQFTHCFYNLKIEPRKIMFNEDKFVKCIQHINNLYTEAETAINRVKSGAKIYRGIEIEPTHVKEFKNAIYMRGGKTLDYWMTGINLDIQRVGKYWTWDRDHANRGGRKEKIREDGVVILEADNVRGINGYLTKIKNIRFESGERELSLFPTAKVDIKRICIWNNGKEKCENVKGLNDLRVAYSYEEDIDEGEMHWK